MTRNHVEEPQENVAKTQKIAILQECRVHIDMTSHLKFNPFIHYKERLFCIGCNVTGLQPRNCMLQVLVKARVVKQAWVSSSSCVALWFCHAFFFQWHLHFLYHLYYLLYSPHCCCCCCCCCHQVHLQLLNVKPVLGLNNLAS